MLASLQEWLANADPLLLRSFALVLCIGDVASGDSLVLTTSKPATAEPMPSLLGSLEAAAGTAGVSIQFQHQKVNMSSPSLAGEHER